MAKTKTTRKTRPAAGAKKSPKTHKKPSKQAHPPQHKNIKPQAGTPIIARPDTKQSVLIAQLQRKEGATIADLVKATGWQAHSVRGAISGTLKKKFGLAVSSEKTEGRGRVYRIQDGR